jgi:hypothetical protein
MRAQSPVRAWDRSGVTVVDGSDVRWINGADAFATMAPAFRDNLGDADRVAELLGRYWLRPLWVDPDTTRRIDHVRVDPGYQDLSEAYHGSVEEALFLGGSAVLTAEGEMRPGDYFWRPPGWVHSAASPTGFECLLLMEGDEPSEGSGPVSRVVCRDEDAGSNPMDDTEYGRIGPRGYVRRLETRFLPAAPLEDERIRLVAPAAEPLTGRLLSRNVQTGSETVLVTVPPGWAGSVPAVDRERFLVVVGGALGVDGRELGACSLVRIAPGGAGPDLSSADGAEVFVKVSSPR